MTTHLPVTPAWMCGGCGTDWPCAQDLAHVPAGHLHNRFLGWSR
ncbi:hypothetical protein EV382_1528 [Micromonospora violae]|uniref:Uncharacterized protein n=1 Tax=Micromonospora violae TaxID=1278207 RepID=A0A4Q7UBF4_9ACTN|nr:hypothetical protein EV382_1528 [Micromonospora violae]